MLLFRANARLLSVLFATIVVPHLVGCAALATIVAPHLVDAKPRHHFDRGTEYTRRAAEANDDIDGLKESIRLLSLAETEHQTAKRSTLQWQENDWALQRVRQELENRRRRLAALDEREEALAQGRHLKFLESARSNLAKGDPAAAFRDIANGERIAGDSEELAALREEVHAAFSSDPSKISDVEQARWFYNVLTVGHVFTGTPRL